MKPGALVRYLKSGESEPEPELGIFIRFLTSAEVIAVRELDSGVPVDVCVYWDDVKEIENNILADLIPAHKTK
jgi:hypothetical protein